MKSLLLRKYILSSALLFLAGCGQSDKQSVPSTTGSMRNNPKNAGAIDYQVLELFLPDIPGYTKGTPEGATPTADNVSYSETNVDYTSQRIDGNNDNEAASINITIYDYAGIPGMLEPYKEKFSFNNAEGYAKTREWDGYAGWETWDKENNSASAGVIMNDRVVVIIEGDGQNDASHVDDVMKKIDLKGIAAHLNTGNGSSVTGKTKR